MMMSYELCVYRINRLSTDHQYDDMYFKYVSLFFLSFFLSISLYLFTLKNFTFKFAYFSITNKNKLTAIKVSQLVCFYFTLMVVVMRESEKERDRATDSLEQC